jgi:hypothetical protein
MSNMDVAVILRLVDQLSGPAKKAAESVKQLITGLKQIQKIKGFESLERQATVVSGAVKKISADVNALSTAFGRLASTSRSAMGSMAVSSSVQASTASQVRHLREMLAIQQQMMRNGARHGGGSVASSLGGSLGYMMAGHRPMHTAFRGLEKAGDLESEVARLRILGFSSADQKRIIERARDTSFSVPIFSQAEALKSFRELNYAFGDTEEALRALPEVAKTLAAMGPEVRDQAMSVVKSGELKNYIKTADDFHDWLESVHRSYQVTGHTVDPDQMLQAFKYSRSALAPYDKEFVSYYMPELVQELTAGGRKGGGGRGGAGTSLAAFKKMFVDHTFAKEHIPEWISLGLIDPTKVAKDKHGAGKMRLLPGALYDQELAAKNPFDYMSKRLLPAFQSAGTDIDNAVDVVKRIATLGGTDLAKQMTQLLILQRKQMEKRVDQAHKVVDLEHSYDIQMDTFKLQWEALKEQATSLTQTTLTPLLPIVNSAMGGIRNLFIGLNKLVHDNPWLATAGAIGAGALGAAAIRRIGAGAISRRLLAGAGATLLTGNLGMGIAAAAMAGRGARAARAVTAGEAAVAGATAGALRGTLLKWAARGGAIGATLLGAKLIKDDVDNPQHPLRRYATATAAEWGYPAARPGYPYRELEKHKGKWRLGDQQLGTNPIWENMSKAWELPPGAHRPVPYLSTANAVGDLGAANRQGYLLGMPRLGTQELINQINVQMPQIREMLAKSIAEMKAIWSTNIPAPHFESPTIPSPPAHTGDPHQKTIGPAPGKQSSLNVGTVHVHVHGAGDPHKVAELVHQRFARAVNRSLSEGAYA